MKTEEQYTVRLSPRSRLHVQFARVRKRVLDFAVNFEIRYRGEWRPVLRYDTAHDHTKTWRFPHKHIFHNKKKEVILRIRSKEYSEVLTLATKDLKKNFRRIKYDFFN